jgi:hypothetical protein
MKNTKAMAQSLFGTDLALTSTNVLLVAIGAEVHRRGCG